MGQMEPEYHEYLNKLINKSKMQERKQIKNSQNKAKYPLKQLGEKNSNLGAEFQSTKSIKPLIDITPANQESDYPLKTQLMNKTTNHQRTKSYADILIQPNRASKETGKIIKGKRTRQSVNKMFMSNQNSPINRQSRPSTKLSHQVEHVYQCNNNFLATLDHYIKDLSETTDNFNDRNHRLEQRRTISKSNLNSTIKTSLNHSSQNNSLENHLEEAIKQIKQLKMVNKYLEIENSKVRAKYSRTKEKTHLMAQHIRYISNELQQERYERNKIQVFFQEIQGKLLSMRPQRKTIGRMQTGEYLLSESTEQDSQISQFAQKTKNYDRSQLHFQNFKKRIIQPKRPIKDRYSLPRSGNQFVSKLSQDKQAARSLTKQQLEAILAEKYHQIDEYFQIHDDNSHQIDIIEL